MSKVILAIDRVSSVHAAMALVDTLCGSVAGYKVGVPFIMEHGPRSVGRLRGMCPEAMWIADLKLADIGAVMVQTAQLVANYVDAVIAHSFVGVRGALDELKNYLDKANRRLILVASMSHPGSIDVYDTVMDRIVGVIEAVRPWGIVAPATRPHVIRSLRKRLPETRILSPGVGAQGAPPGSALCSGADYEIIGRAVTQSPDPLKAVQEISRLQEEALQSCRS